MTLSGLSLLVDATISLMLGLLLFDATFSLMLGLLSRKEIFWS